MMPRIKLWAGLVLLFGTGVIAGSVGSSLYGDVLRPKAERGPLAQHDRIMKYPSQQLSLTPQQRSEIEPIVTHTHVAILELRFSHQPEIEQILSSSMGELKAKLSATQQAEVDKLYNRLEHRWQVYRAYLEDQKKGMTTH